MRRRYLLLLLLLLIPPAAFLAADALFPLPRPDPAQKYSRVLLDSAGRPLYAFADREGVWRYPTTPNQVSPLYLTALINYEDRYFYHHLGVNPLALLRATGQLLRHGGVVSGGSTLTMQVARLLDPHSRTIGGKLRQMFRALQLEWHLSKSEILTLYLDYAPFGGPLEGVEAAAYTYLGKSAAELSHAEAALLAVLPQAPTRLRPDLHPAQALAARNKVLARLEKFGIWDATTVREAQAEPLPTLYQPRPLSAPLLAFRLKDQIPPGQARRSTIDGQLQAVLEGRLAGFASQLPERSSVAIVVIENANLAVRAYVGTAAFGDRERFGYLDMARATRSPGSTLKPFLYALALEEGLIHSASLLVDAPRAFGDYSPGNFGGNFSGPVAAADALRRSLNLPAVQLLDRLGPDLFAARLAQGGLPLQLPAGGSPNLAIILGGVGTDLESLTAAYTAFARAGTTAPPRHFPDDPLQPRLLRTPGPAWVVREILAQQPRPGVSGGLPSGIAWKTGTSYGFRDAWAIGVGPQHTVGVWVGRPDGTPLPGHYGAITAAPILFALFDHLLERQRWGTGQARPESVSEEEICWPLGLRASDTPTEQCQRRQRAWVVAGTIPPTLREADEGPALLHYRVASDSGLLLPPGCPAPASEERIAVRWPLRLLPWLSPAERATATLPPPQAGCALPVTLGGEPLRIIGVEDGARLRPAGSHGTAPRVDLSILGAQDRVWWLVDGEVAAELTATATFSWRFDTPGRHRIAALDGSGNGAGLEVVVEGH